MILERAFERVADYLKLNQLQQIILLVILYSLIAGFVMFLAILSKMEFDKQMDLIK